MDGGSQDGTIEILKNYKDRVCWYSNPDNGQSAAINRGWKLQNGDIYGWLNSDDLLYPGALQAVNSFFSTHPDIDIVYGNCDYINSFGQVIGGYPTRPFDYSDLFINATNFLPQPATFIRKRVLVSSGYLNEELHYTMDYEFWLRAGLRHNIAHIPQKLACLRIHHQAKSVQSLERFAFELVQIYQNMFTREDLPVELKQMHSKTMGTVYMRAADCSFWAGNIKNSRIFAAKAWKVNPFRLRTLWGLILLGNLGLKIAHRRYENPYLSTKNGLERKKGI